MTSGIRFGLQVVEVASPSELAEVARRAEAAGFDTLLAGDHVGTPDPFLVLQAAADATTTLGVGTYVLNNDFHDPVLLARAVATLDVLSDGRFELGLGAGHSQPEYEARGVPFQPAAERVARLAEAVTVLRRLLGGETVTFDGAYYRLRDAACSPAPRQARIPIVVGGNGLTVLRLAAREADGVGLTGLGRTLADGMRHEVDHSTASLEQRLRMIDEVAGARPLERSALVQVVALTDDRRATARRIAERVPGIDRDRCARDAVPVVRVAVPAGRSDRDGAPTVGSRLFRHPRGRPRRDGGRHRGRAGPLRRRPPMSAGH